MRRDRTADPRRGARRRALRRNRGLPAFAARSTWGSSRTRSSAPASTPGSTAARAGRTRPAAPSSRSSAVPSNASPPSASPSTSRSAQVPEAGCGESADVLRACRRSDRGIREYRGAGRPPWTPFCRRSPNVTTRRNRRRRAPRAVEVGADDRRGAVDRRRSGALAAPAARPAGRATTQQIEEEACAKTPNRRALASLERDLRNLAHLASSPCQSWRRLPPGRRRRPGASGSSASAISRRACCAGPRACCASSASCARWPPSARSTSKRRATCSPNGCARSTSSRRADRYGRVFVGSPHQARGRAFKVVFVPGLAERLFPQKLREDPLLLDDEMRAPLAAPACFVQDDRAQDRAAAAAPRRRRGDGSAVAVVSAPRRRRRPPARALVLRARRHARHHRPNPAPRSAAAGRGGGGGAKLDWPAPPRPSEAIDDVEHDLATLRLLIDVPDRARSAGTRTTCSASTPRCGDRCTSDGRGRDRVAAAGRPGARDRRQSSRCSTRSASARARTPCRRCRNSRPVRTSSSCRQSIGSSRTIEPEPLQRLDPLTRGSMFHEVQAAFFRALHAGTAAAADAGGRAARAAGAGDGAQTSPRRLQGAAGAGHRARVARRDCRASAATCACGSASCRSRRPWTPEYFEFSFGLADEGRDERSQRDPVLIDGRFILRGSVDLIETREGSPELRITDHKTGRNRTTPRTVIGGGGDAAAGASTGSPSSRSSARPVREGRLFYCTTAGGFAEHPVPLSDVEPPRRARSARDHRPRHRARASCRRHPPSAPARGATSARSAAPTSRGTSRAKRPSRSAI